MTVLDSSLNTVISQSFDAYLAGVDNWQLKSLGILLSPGSYNLTFLAQGVPAGLDTLLDNVSLTANAVPAPVIGHGLLIVLAVGGVLFGSKLLERSKKLHATA